MQSKATLNGSRNVIFQLIIRDIFLISCSKIDDGWSLRAPIIYVFELKAEL